MDPEQLLSGARDAINVRRVFGEPIEQDANGGGGFGLVARPVGVYVTRDGQVSWRPAVDPVRTELGWQIVPGLAVLSAWSILRRLRR